MDDIIAQVRTIAAARCYSHSEVEAGLEHYRRKVRLSHPPGKWDNAKRFYASEQTTFVRQCRSPSRAWPLSEMKAARTAAHCAEIYGVEDVLAVRRVARALEVAQEVWPEGGEAAAASAATHVLKLRRGTAPAANTHPGLPDVA